MTLLSTRGRRLGWKVGRMKHPTPETALLPLTVNNGGSLSLIT